MNRKGGVGARNREEGKQNVLHDRRVGNEEVQDYRSRIAMIALQKSCSALASLCGVSTHICKLETMTIYELHY